MATRLVQINMKARDDCALGDFWAQALGWVVSSEGPGVTNLEPEGLRYPDPAAVCVDLIASPEPKTVKNRVHVDLATTSAAHQAQVVLESPYRDTGPIASVVVDCADPRAMARFWGNAMDWTVHEVTDRSAVLRSASGVGPYLRFLRTPDVKTGWNRVHLDIRPYPGDDPAAETGRLQTLGATVIDLGRSDIRWTVLADPEGNEFCLLAPS